MRARCLDDGELRAGAPVSGAVLVTGASGFIGRALVASLAQSGRPVRAATRHPEELPLRPGRRGCHDRRLGAADRVGAATSRCRCRRPSRRHRARRPGRCSRALRSRQSPRHRGSRRRMRALRRCTLRFYFIRACAGRSRISVHRARERCAAADRALRALQAAGRGGSAGAAARVDNFAPDIGLWPGDKRQCREFKATCPAACPASLCRVYQRQALASWPRQSPFRYPFFA